MDEQYLSVASLHALAYCERLFYLEEVEWVRVADAAVFAGRRLHAEIELAEDEQEPRSAAHTLVLDVMELFRVPLVDMALRGAINRRTFDPAADFAFSPG